MIFYTHVQCNNGMTGEKRGLEEYCKLSG